MTEVYRSAVSPSKSFAPCPYRAGRCWHTRGYGPACRLARGDRDGGPGSRPAGWPRAPAGGESAARGPRSSAACSRSRSSSVPAVPGRAGSWGGARAPGRAAPAPRARAGVPSRRRGGPSPPPDPRSIAESATGQIGARLPANPRGRSRGRVALWGGEDGGPVIHGERSCA
jgi:hypothetical protein